MRYLKIVLLLMLFLGFTEAASADSTAFFASSTDLTWALTVLREFDLFGRISVVGLAKREEELFRPFESDPILLPRRSEGLYLVQRVRDEAHRFAITAHHNRRTRSGLTSELEKIPGIGLRPLLVPGKSC